jgi:hypothetical protein
MNDWRNCWMWYIKLWKLIGEMLWLFEFDFNNYEGKYVN